MMRTFSLKHLLAAVFVVGICCAMFVRPGISMAKVSMVAVTISIFAAACVGLRSRRPIAFVFVILSMVYLAMADGGILPSAERYLPPEWGLERCCGWHTSFDNGRRRSISLTKWVLAVNPKHKDWQYVTEAKRKTSSDKRTPPETEPTTDETLEDLLDLADTNLSDEATGLLEPSVKLPVVVPTPVTRVTISRKRDLPQNRPFFIMGHCLVVTLLSANGIIYISATSNRKARSPIGVSLNNH